MDFLFLFSCSICYFIVLQLYLPSLTLSSCSLPSHTHHQQSLFHTRLILFLGLDSTYEREQLIFVFLCLLILFNMMTSSCLHLPANEIISLLFTAECIYIYICIYIHIYMFIYLFIFENIYIHTTYSLPINFLMNT
jgi:hypothetical protein